MFENWEKNSQKNIFKKSSQFSRNFPEFPINLNFSYLKSLPFPGSLLGSPVVIAATAVVSVPLICGLIPFAVGRRVYKKLKGGSKAKRVVATAAAVTGSAVVSPMVAGFTVGWF